MNFAIIVAIDQKGGIGKGNTIPWHLSADLKHFAAVTKKTQDPLKQNALIMGANTWRSLPETYRPLPGRLNIVLNREKDLAVPAGVEIFSSVEDVFTFIEKQKGIEQTFVIGGGQLYNSMIELPGCKKLYITHILHDYECDVFFPIEKINTFSKVFESDIFESDGIRYQFIQYEK